MKTHWEVGDRLVNDRYPHVVREIVEVLECGYMWRFADHDDKCPNGKKNLFNSNDSNDVMMLPMFGWSKK